MPARSHANYELFEEIGRSSHAVVYAGYNQLTKQNVAIKEFADPTDPDQVARLRETAQFHAGLSDYSHVLEVKDLIPENGWLVFDRMKESLADRLKREGRGLPPDEVRTILRQTLAGLDELHQKGRWAGHLRPSNLLVAEDGEVRIADTPGLMADGVVRPPDGKVNKYLAPERISPEFGPVGPATDLYSLGFTALELLAGRKVDEIFGGTGADAIDPDVGWLRVHGSRAENFPPASEVVRGLPADLSRVIDRLLQKNVQDRYASVGEVLANLSAHPPREHRPSREDRPPQEARRRDDGTMRPVTGEKKKFRLSWPVLAAGGLLLLLLIFVGIIRNTTPDDGVVEITTTPPGASVIWVDNDDKVSQKLTPGPFTVQVREKPRKVRLELDGYEPYPLEIEPEPGDTKTYTVELKPMQNLIPVDVEMEIRSKPSDALVQLNGEGRGSTPLKVKLRPGTYEVRVEKEGFMPLTRQVEVKAGGPKSETFDLTPVLPPVVDGAVRFVSKPAGGRVSVDGVAKGKTPLTLELKAGKYKVQVELDGHEPLARQIEVATGRNQEEAFDLKPVPPPVVDGAVTFSSKLAGARVSVDGVAKGKTPLTLKLKAGKYAVQVELDGHKPLTRQIEVAAGRTLEEAFDLMKDDEDPQFAADLKECESLLLDGKTLKDYLSGTAVRRYPTWLKGEAADIAAARVLVAHCLREGIGVAAKDEARAVELYSKADAVGQPAATYRLGQMHASGRGGLTKDQAKANQFFDRAIEAGYPLAMSLVGEQHMDGTNGREKDPKRAGELFAKAADKGDVIAAYRRGLILLKSELAVAEKLFKMGADKQYPPSVFRHASLLLNSEDGKQIEQGFNTLTGLVDGKKPLAGFEDVWANAHTLLGTVCYSGKGDIQQDLKRAARHFRTALDLGDAVAAYNLAVMLEGGEGGLKPDDAETFRLYEKAATQGHQKAIRTMINVYEKGGLGQEKDSGKATKWRERLTNK